MVFWHDMCCVLIGWHMRYHGFQPRMGRIRIDFTYDGDITLCRFKQVWTWHVIKLLVVPNLSNLCTISLFPLKQRTQTFSNWFVGVFNGVILFSQWPDFNGGGGCTITPRVFCACQKSGISVLCTSSFAFTFCFHCVYRGNSFVVPIYNNVKGPAAACLVVWGFPRCSLNIFIRVGMLSLRHIHHTVSFSLYTQKEHEIT